RGGKRYTFNIGSSHGILVYNCSSEDGRHDFVVGARTCGPNAFVKCSVPEGGNGEPHHRWGNGTLWDNVSMPNGGVLASFNRGDSGSGHGWAGANSVFWNCNAENIVVFDPETEGENNFAIGYTGTVTNEYPAGGLYYANTRAGYWDTPQEGEYYGYAAMGSGYIESPDGPVKPDSLFKQQLIDRIGRETAVQVLSPGERPTAVEPYNEQKTSREAESNVLFEDPMDGDWQKNWFLDGKKTLLMNLDGGLYFSAGSVTKYDDKVEYNAHHAVLWTQQEFDGDIRVSFETKQVDQSDYGNVLIYLQAQGIGTPPYEEDISGWSELREVPAMNKYFTYMDLLSLSLRKELRLRRYPLRSMDGSEKFSSLIGSMEDWHGMTRDKWFRFVIEKRKESYTFKSYDAETGELLEEFTWDTSGQGGKRDLPFVEKGRIGLRHMSTKKSIYKNFKVERL
ncbi:MAG TPA: hypothetical protein VJ904_13845, partial [Tichowtungia sp.]|nr:hypothetical protein [Tichowtungia sp.]